MTPWTVAHQAPPSMGILQARVLEWVAISFSRDLLDPGIEPRSPALWVDSLLTELKGKPPDMSLFLVCATGSAYLSSFRNRWDGGYSRARASQVRAAGQ